MSPKEIETEITRLRPVGKRVDPSTMTTDIGRTMANRLNRDLDVSELKLHRLVEVLNEYLSYAEDSQLDLAEAAIIWSFVSLTVHPRRDECKSNFFAFVDIMYSSTEDAAQILSDSERQQVVIAAGAVQRHLIPAVNDILRSSAEIMLNYNADSLLRMTGQALHQVRMTDLEHAPRNLVRDLIGNCYAMCQAIEGYEVGVTSDAEYLKAIEQVGRNTVQISTEVVEAVKNGSLIVQDGKILKRVELKGPQGNLPTWTHALSQLRERYPSLPDDWIWLNYVTEKVVFDSLFAFTKQERNGPICELASFVRNQLWLFWYSFVIDITDLIFWTESEGYRHQAAIRNLAPADYLKLIGLFARSYITIQRRPGDKVTRLWLAVIDSVFDVESVSSNEKWFALGSLPSDSTTFAAQWIVYFNTEVDGLLGLPSPKWPTVITAEAVDALVRAGQTHKWHGVYYIINQTVVKLSNSEAELRVSELFDRLDN